VRAAQVRGTPVQVDQLDAREVFEDEWLYDDGLYDGGFQRCWALASDVERWLCGRRAGCWDVRRHGAGPLVCA
jgi:hypothetical protein